MKSAACTHRAKDLKKVKSLLLTEAKNVLKEDKAICRMMGKLGSTLIKNGDKILTHCNAGALAAADYGTALGVLFSAHHDGKKIKVYADETRPLLQGARLTVWELMREKIDTTLVTDNMAAYLMLTDKIDKIIVGADRIAKNGDAANKIGTYALAISAKYHRIPFYVVAPISTIDMNVKSGKDIPIEERHPDEVRKIRGIYIAPRTVKVRNPAFDVTPASLITAIVTEKGILRKPYKKSIERAVKHMTAL